MDLKELDRQFQAVMDRLKSNQGLAASPYTTPVPSGDHDLLQKSWDYFRQRIKSMSDQWAEMLSAKSKENEILKKELALSKSQLDELKSDLGARQELEAAVHQERSEDYQR